MKKLMILPFLLIVVGCEGCNSTDDKQRKAQEVLQAEGDRQAGLPNIVNFQEKKLMKMIYELRDQENLITYVYTVALDGKPVFLTKAMGYGLPYATQYSNPQKRDGSSGVVLPQAEPNGLFTPPGAEGTWIMAISKTDGKPHPMYVEPRIIVSPFPLNPNDK